MAEKNKPKLTPLETGMVAELASIIGMLADDGRLTDEEIRALQAWFEDRTKVVLTPQVERLRAIVGESLADGKITATERREITRAAEAVVPPAVRPVLQLRRKNAAAEDKEQAKEDRLAAKEEEKLTKALSRPVWSLNFVVAGVSYQDRGDIVRRSVQVPHKVFLVPTPSNAYDPMAIEVRLASGETIGFMPRVNNAEPFRHIGAGCRQEATVVKIIQGRKAPIPVVDAYLFRPTSAQGYLLETWQIDNARPSPSTELATLSGKSTATGCSTGLALLVAAVAVVGLLAVSC